MLKQREILNCLQKGRPQSNAKYNESVRMFALAIHFYSPRAYQYIRELFDNHLPDKSTLRKWYVHSSGNVELGFCPQSLEVLTKKVKELNAGGIEPVCSLIFDEMAIKNTCNGVNSRKSSSVQLITVFDQIVLNCL